MKRLLLLCTVITCSLALTAQNVLKNPQWKELTPQGKPANWTPFSETKFQIGGPQGADFVIYGEDKANVTVTQQLKLEPNTPYILTFSCRSDVGAISQTYVEWNFPQNNELIHHNSGAARFTVPAQWTEYKQTFSLPDNYKVCYLALRSPLGPPIAYKNVSLRPAKIRREPSLGGYWNLEQINKYTDDAIILQGGETATVYRVAVEPGKRYRLSYDACGTGAVDPAYPFHEIVTQITPNVQGAFAFNDVSNATQRKFQNFSIPADATFKSIAIAFSAKTSAKSAIAFSNFKLDVVVPDPTENWQFVLDEPFYRDTIYASQKLDTMKARLVTDGAAAAYKVTFNGQTYEGNTTPDLQIAIPVNNLPEGSYPLACTVYDANRKELKSFSRRVLKVAPSPAEIIGLPNRFFAINGKPFHPNVLWTLRDWSDEFLYYAARHGVNCTMLHLRHNLEEALATLDQAQKFGIKIIVPTGYAESNPASQKRFRDKLNDRFPLAIRQHPAFFGYFITDEPLWGGKSYIPLQDTFELFRDFDPYHPTWINAAPRNEVADLRPYAEACDIWGCDIYPIPQPNSHSGLDDKTITSVGKYCLRMDETTWHRKPIWMALQGFGWGENPECGPLGRAKIHPTLSQMRYMAFDAVLNGCTGFGLWGTQFVKDIDFAEIIFKTTAEVHQYSALYLNGTPLPPAKSSNPAIRAQIIKHQGNLYYFIMNLTDKAAKGTVDINPQATEVLAADNADVKFVAEQASLSLKPYGFLVCATAALPPPAYELTPVIPELEAKGSPIPGIITTQLEELMNRKLFSTNASWIWDASTVRIAGNTCFIAKSFQANPGQNVKLRLAVDDLSTVFINGKEIGATKDWDKLFEFNLTPNLKNGENLLVIRASDAGGLPCGLIAELQIDATVILSDNSWLTIAGKDEKSPLPATLDGFKPAIIVQPYGGGAWGKNVIDTKK